MLVCFFGKRGAGKTHAIKNAIKDAVKPAVVVDFLGNFQELEGAFVTDSTTEALEAIARFKEYEKTDQRARRFMDEPASVIVVQPLNENESVNYISAYLWEEGNATLVLDEADLIRVADAPMFMYLVKYGRNRSVHLLTGCRRPAELSRNITAGANAVYIFRTQEKRDVDYFAATLLGEEQAERLPKLKRYHGLFINHDTLTIGEFMTNEKGEVIILSEQQIETE